MSNPIYYKRISGSSIQGDATTVTEPSGTLVIANGGELRLHDGSTAGGNPVGGSIGSFGTDKGIGSDYASNNPAILFSDDDMIIRTGGTVGHGTIGAMYIASAEELIIGHTDASLTDATSLGAGNYTDYLQIDTNGIEMTTARGTVQFGYNLEAPGVPTHFHINKLNQSFDLFFGDDANYFHLPAGSGSPVIGANDTNSGQKLWTFGQDGTTTFPNSRIDVKDDLTLRVLGVPNAVTGLTGSPQGGWSGSYTNLTTTGGSGTGLTVNASESGSGYIDTVTIATPGHGYTDGDTITITSGGATAYFIISILPAQSWTLGGDGVLTFPDNTRQTTAWTGTVAYSNVSGTPNLSVYATQPTVSTLQIAVNNLTNTLSTLTTTATVNSLIANSLTNYATQTYVTTRGYLTTVTSVAQATSANIVTTAAQPNITSVGTLTSLSVSGNVTATKFIGDGSSLTNVTVNVAGSILGTGTNVTLVAGNYSYLFDNTGVLTLPSQSITTGDEGAEIDFTKAPSSSLSGNAVIFDQYVNKFRFFESGGTNRGVYIDLTQAAAGVNTLLNNRVAAYADAGVFVTMDNIKATVPTSGNRGLSLATVSGTFTYSISGVFGATGGSAGLSLASQSLTTTATTSIFGWNFGGNGDAATYILNDTTNNRAYRITLQIGPGYSKNMISIERLI